MKFLQELASCYRPPTSASPSLQEEDEPFHVATPLPSGRCHAKRVNKPGGGGSASRHWRPVLHAITEDGVQFGSEAKNKIAEKRARENKSKGRYYTSKPHRVRHYENSFYSRNDDISESMSVPAFCPTPF
ncbi:hypothetical protein HRI_004007100 [Hibiscus trionum]|uniref:Uncharacterized protein n=1 Tax=Hibiscus trionum TaxID=183268 RepID=A0A9W7IY34_HIBTR|nr:hypothetical protein HRI_004007100 [Hibiscus trionum]